MQHGFDITGAKSKRDQGEDSPSRAPMAPRGPARTSLSTDDRKVRRQDSMRRSASKESITVNINRREAALLAEMPGASLERQRQIVAELDQIKNLRVAQAQRDRELDLGGAVIRDTMTPVVTAALHTTATDWMDPEAGAPDAQGVQMAMTAAASQWFSRTSPEVKADADEYAIQVRGTAQRLAGAHAPLDAVAADAFVRHAMFLNRQASGRHLAVTLTEGNVGSEAERVAEEAREQTFGDILDLSGEDIEEIVDGICERRYPGDPMAKDVADQAINIVISGSKRTAADADINPYPANEQAGYAESGLPAAVPVEGYDTEGEENGALDNFAPPVAPENAGAVAQEGQAVPMPGFGEQVTSAVEAGFRHIDVPVFGFQTASQREAQVHTAVEYGTQTTCGTCGSDIEYHGEAGWLDRGSNTYCDESGQHPLIDGGDGGYGDYPHVKHSPVTAARRTAADWREELQPLLEEQAPAGPRPISEIAWEIQADWKNVNYGAVPYLDAMKQLTSVTDRFYQDDARSIINYFLSNASSWRGEKAKAIKAELKAMIGRKASLHTAAGGAKAIAIYPDKRVEEVTISGYKDGQAIVGGYIEPVNLSDGSTMWVNEEYLYSFSPDDVNWIASDVCGLGGRPEFMLRQPILGPVYITGPADGEGNTTDVTDQARRWVQRVGREAGAKFAAKHAGQSVTCNSCGHEFSDRTQNGANTCPQCKSSDLRRTHAAKTAAEGCQWLVERRRNIPNEAYEDGWYPDSPSDLVEIAPCGGDTVGDSGLCQFHLDAANMDDRQFEYEIEHGRTWSSRRTSSVSLTNVSFEGGIGSNVGVGTDSQGNRVRFRLSDQDAADLASVLTGDLGMNFSGVDVDEADIITTASHRHAGTDPEDQNGNAETALPTPETNTDTMWPWELPEGEVQTGQDAANVSSVPTPGGEAGYPQPTAARTAAPTERSWPCKVCGKTVVSDGGYDTECQQCGTPYNAWGQRLRDDWASNPSNWDDEIGDMEGFEMSQRDASRRTAAAADEVVHAFRTFLGIPPAKGIDFPVCGARITDAYDFAPGDRPKCPDCAAIMAASNV